VILTACETAIDMSNLQNLDEYCGLDLAFCIAGAKCVFSTLWAVADPLAAVASWALIGRLLRGERGAGTLLGPFQQQLRNGTWHQWILSDNQILEFPIHLRSAFRGVMDQLRSIPHDAFIDRRHWSVFRCLTG